MLVLSRKRNESIVVDDVIEIVVLEVRGNRVRLGINAPQEIRIVRGEIEDVEVVAVGQRAAEACCEQPETCGVV